MFPAIYWVPNVVTKSELEKHEFPIFFLQHFATIVVFSGSINCPGAQISGKAMHAVRTQCARSAKFWMSANTRTLLLAPFDKFLVPYWVFF